MKVTLLVTGLSDDRDLAPAIERYVKRLGHYVPFDLEELKPPKHFSKLGVDELKKEEGQLLLARLTPQDTVVLLDERGRQFNSIGFAEHLQKWMNAGGRRIVFIVGGAFGFSDEVYKRADHQMALSALTLTHQMVRLFFVEQLYRAFTILRNEKYHH
jgi:23S rRNA (pseudouridine1915-N3)-methyltransferase